MRDKDRGGMEWEREREREGREMGGERWREIYRDR